jgi:hypothetical protein
MAIPTLYVGACYNWTFTFTNDAGAAVDLTTADEVQVRFTRGSTVNVQIPTLTGITGHALDGLDRAHRVHGRPRHPRELTHATIPSKERVR